MNPKPFLGIVYIITNLVNGKVYVGCTTGSLKGRWRRHRWSAKHPGRGACALHAAIRKYGSQSFSIRALEVVSTSVEDLRAVEVKLIAIHKSLVPHGYNLTKGGEGVDFNPVVRERHLVAVRQRSARPEWRKAQVEGSRRRSSDPEWQANCAAANKRLANDALWKETLVRVLSKAQAGFAAKTAVVDATLPTEELARRLKHRARNRAYYARQRTAQDM